MKNNNMKEVAAPRESYWWNKFDFSKLPKGFHVQRDNTQKQKKSLFFPSLKVNRKFHCLKIFSNFFFRE